MSSDRPTNHNAATPSKGKQRGRKEPQRGQSDPANSKQAALDSIPENLMERVVEPDNMLRAWKKVKANRGAPGPDGVTLDQYEQTLSEAWPAIRQQLLDGTYRPQPVRRKAIPKADGTQRLLGIPNVQDRLIQQAVQQVLTPIFDPGFSESSFGYRPRKSAQGAIKQVQANMQKGYRYCVDMDLEKFFDSVQHDRLLSQVARRVRDKRVLRLVGRYLRAGVMEGTDLRPTPTGTMQGGPLSPLLANILLDDLDKELEHRGLPFVRYADDFLVFTKTEQAARRVYGSVGRYLTRKLKLQVNRRKSRICRTDGVEYLSYQMAGFGGRPQISRKSLKKFKARVREITRRNRGISMRSRLRELNQYFRGWVGYFSLVYYVKPFSRLDRWVRRRLRSVYWKQWRRPRTRVRKLLRYGVAYDSAVRHGVSGKGPWALSKTEAMHIAISDKHLRERGFIPLEDHWKKFAPKWRTA